MSVLNLRPIAIVLHRPEVIRFRSARLAITCLLPILGCACASAAPITIIPGTNVGVDELLVLPGADRAFDWKDPPALTLCRPPEIDVRGTVYGMVAGRYPFPRGITHTDAPCPFEFRVAPKTPARPYDYTVDACAFQLDVDRNEVTGLHAFVRPNATEDEVRECGIRQGFFLLGYGGALTMPREKLFKKTSATLLIGQEQVLGKTTVHAIAQFVQWCAPLDRKPWGGMTREAIRREIRCRSNI